MAVADPRRAGFTTALPLGCGQIEADCLDLGDPDHEVKYPMKTSISLAAVAALSTLGFGAQAQDITGRVISSTPVVQQVQVPRQICSNQPYAV